MTHVAGGSAQAMIDLPGTPLMPTPPMPPESAMNADIERGRMVEQQLRARGLSDERVLDAMRTVPREAFLPPTMREFAYRDSALPIAHGQTISQPYTVAFMCDAVGLTGAEKVLEVGAGSGYAACVLSRLAGQVFSIERIPELAAEARRRVAALGYDNVEVTCGDGTVGLPDEAPFDAIIVTAGAPELPSAYTRQIADGGRIIIPVGDATNSQRMCRFTRRDDELLKEDLGGFLFVPLIGDDGWDIDIGTS
jgi:protein-L-isoaspartate(D-aspartate) O-methyltransferase